MEVYIEPSSTRLLQVGSNSETEGTISEDIVRHL